MSAPQTYGASLYDLAKDEGMSREILVDLAGIVSLFNEHPAYVKILDSPQIERDDLMEILNEDFLGKVNRYVLNFLKLLSEKHSVHHIGECFKTYEKLNNEDNSIKIVNVTTAKPIGKHLEEKLLQKLEKKTGGKVVLKMHVDKKCIGGIIIETDGIRIDSSIKSGLEDLKKALI